MLTITPRAMTVIRRVTTHPKLAPTSGVRIAPRDDVHGPARSDATLDVRIVPGPQTNDRIVEQEGGRLYLAPEAFERVEGRELDAVTDRDGRVQFVSRTAA
ncbi:hypothetical protein GCM10009795_011530 [Nocardioides hankookensis]|uniref:Fe-S cluster assembly protein HesB n=1 Tax=Nocardioides hankookensis TaxID=443157 RepID=A0ABW1LIC1_9ACTN